MVDQRCGTARRLTCAERAAVSLAALWLVAGAAHAAEVKYPHAKPAVALDVPDDWVIDKDKGLDMRSPDKKAIAVGDVLKRDKAKLDAWAKGATEKLKAFGVAFDPNAKAPPKPEAAKPIEAPSAFTTKPDAFTFSGKPSLAPPGTANSNNPVKPGPTSLEVLTSKDASAFPAPKVTVLPKLPFHAVQYYGTTMNGQPVDVQLLIYTLPDKRVFVMMQESGADDPRTVAIAQSVRAAKSAEAKAKSEKRREEKRKGETPKAEAPKVDAAPAEAPAAEPPKAE